MRGTLLENTIRMMRTGGPPFQKTFILKRLKLSQAGQPAPEMGQSAGPHQSVRPAQLWRVLAEKWWFFGVFGNIYLGQHGKPSFVCICWMGQNQWRWKGSTALVWNPAMTMKHLQPQNKIPKPVFSLNHHVYLPTIMSNFHDPWSDHI